MSSSERWMSKFQIKEDTWVFVPTNETIEYGLVVKKAIEEKWSPPSIYYHLKKGGHIKALCQHLSNKYFIHLDIQDFFGRINRSRITRCIKDFMSYENSRDIAIKSTVRKPDATERRYILPFGFVQSPIIASLCMSKSALGRRLVNISKRLDFEVSIYMDDIIVSTNDLVGLNSQLDLIEAAAIRSGFPLNKDKQEGPGPSVTAFNICISQGLLEITGDRITEFTNTYSHSTNEYQRAGILSYIRSINPKQADKYIS